MKLSKIILENNKVVKREELNLSHKDILKLTEAISSKLEEYLDIDNKALLTKTVEAAIGELLDTPKK